MRNADGVTVLRVDAAVVAHVEVNGPRSVRRVVAERQSDALALHRVAATGRVPAAHVAAAAHVSCGCREMRSECTDDCLQQTRRIVRWILL